LKLLLVFQKISAIFLQVFHRLIQKLVAISIALIIFVEDCELLQIFELWKESHHPVMV